MDKSKRLSDRRILFFYDAGIPLCRTVERAIEDLAAEGTLWPGLVLRKDEEVPVELTQKLSKLVSPAHIETVNMEQLCFCSYGSADLLFLFTGSSFLLFHLEHFYSRNCLKQMYGKDPFPAVIALPPETSDLSLNSVISPLFSRDRVFWVPFGWALSVKNRYILSTRTDLWVESCAKALDNRQIEPRYWEHCSHH